MAPVLTRAQKAAATRATNALKKEAAQAKRNTVRIAKVGGTKRQSDANSIEAEEVLRHSKRVKVCILPFVLG